MIFKRLFDSLYLYLCLLSGSNVVVSADSSRADLPPPIAVPPTQLWDGNDGPWSTFSTSVGSPAQPLRLLPSTSGIAIWPVLSEACPPGGPSNCAQQRASFFDPNASTTWSQIGIYELLLTEERSLGLAANGSFGLDNVAIGMPGSPNATGLDQTMIGAFEDTNIYVGTIGLYPAAVNLSNITAPRPSFMGAMRNQSKIPSTLWSYTAGASYRQPTAFGSLTLGGYDALRFVPNSLNFSFGPDSSRDLVVGIQSIRSGTESLLPNGIYAFLDSVVPEIWLPVEACQRFEGVFGISYNSSAERYFVNDTLHDKLVAESPNITLTLGPSSSGGPSVDIVMQYGSFDLSYEDVSTGYQSRYFPLRRAQNFSMYTLGRTFFQDAYVIANYDRANFSVSQVIFPNSSNAQQEIVTVRPPDTDDAASVSKTLSPGRIAGTVVGVVLVVILSIIGVVYWQSRSLRNSAGRTDKPDTSESQGDEGTPSGFGKSELPNFTARHELTNTGHITPELSNGNTLPFELAGISKEAPVELYGSAEVEDHDPRQRDPALAIIEGGDKSHPGSRSHSGSQSQTRYLNAHSLAGIDGDTPHHHPDSQSRYRLSDNRQLLTTQAGRKTPRQLWTFVAILVQSGMFGRNINN